MKNTLLRRVPSTAEFLHKHFVYKVSEKSFKRNTSRFLSQMVIMKITNKKDKLITCIGAAVMVALMYFLKIPCLFKWLFHIECPGCGITRACLSVLRLDFASAFEFNPMFWSVPILFVLYLLDGKIFNREWIGNVLYALIFSGFFINWIVKLVA